MTAVTSVSKLRAAALVLAAIVLPGAASAASDATGVWLNDTGRGAIEIKQCGGALCGHVVWVKDGSDAKGCGRQIIGDAQPVKTGLWDNGWIYSPEKKKRYDVELKAMDGDKLRVTGYAGSKFFSKTMIWKRAPADLERCGTETAKAAAPPAKASASATAAVTAPAVAAGQPEAYRSAEEKLRDRVQKEDEAKAAETAPAPSEAEETTTETADAGDLGLGGLKLDKYLKKENGKCALDLPWVKVNFKCKDL
ncbi:MAG: DUF2147 domain-containing protein [Hyphomicrobiaceae bacterium]|nr:DUF2147 domain-containing protein [Hyphomicrobiaceae bacterium]